MFLTLFLRRQSVPVRVGAKIASKIVKKLRVSFNVPYFLNPNIKQEIEEAMRRPNPF